MALERFGYRPGRSLPLTVGREYTAYAIAFLGEQVWYFIENDDADVLRYPSREPAELFQVTEGSIPRCWRFAFTPGHSDHQALMAFPEWTEDRFFYDRLTDGQVREVEIFERRRRAIDLELAGLQLVRNPEPGHE
jgi:hypothetical protein